ncbi:MAG: phenylacetate--CoA ligase family protein [Bacteroidales bacterium]
MIWNESVECMSREMLFDLQSKRLKEMVAYVYEHTPFYRKKMDESGVKPSDIHSINDIVKLPFTTKDDLRDNYPFGLCAVPMKEIVRVHASSGTTGKPTVVGYTRNDLKNWTECLSRCFTAFGGTKEDMFHISYGYGLFTGGMGAHYGAENIGASVIPMSSGNTDKQILLMKDFGSSVLCCTPSYALYLADKIHESGIARDEFKLRVGAFGAEPWTEEMRLEIEDKLGIRAFDIYGLSEVAGPGVGFECECQNGTHLNEDHFFPEIIDPNTFKQVKAGEQGELVFTHLTKEGMPLLRYRTKDLTSLNHQTCECGRTLVRMDRILGRSDDMLIIRGVNVFPSQIESVILSMEEFAPQYMIYVDRVNNQDQMEIWVEVRESYFTDELEKMLSMKKKLTAAIQSVLGIAVPVKLVEPKSIERSEGKAKRVVDKRIFK